MLRHHRTFDEKQNFSLHGYLFALTRGGFISVYISSPAPVSVNRAYHEIWGAVKRKAPTATSRGRGETYGIVEMTKGKLTYHFGRSLPSNDRDKRGTTGRHRVLRKVRLQLKGKRFRLDCGRNRRTFPYAQDIIPAQGDELIERLQTCCNSCP